MIGGSDWGFLFLYNKRKNLVNNWNKLIMDGFVLVGIEMFVIYRI